MTELDFSLATTEEILKELGKRAKEKRKREIDYFGSQKDVKILRKYQKK